MDASLKMRSSSTRVSSFQVHTITTWTHPSPRTATVSVGHRKYASSGESSAIAPDSAGRKATWARTRAAKASASSIRSGPTTRRVVSTHRLSAVTYRMSIDDTRRDAIGSTPSLVEDRGEAVLGPVEVV